MKILMVVSLGLAAMEYFHHHADHHTHVEHGSAAQTTPKAKAEAARELYRQHMRSHH
jgi:hypothetical protein